MENRFQPPSFQINNPNKNSLPFLSKPQHPRFNDDELIPQQSVKLINLVQVDDVEQEEGIKLDMQLKRRIIQSTSFSEQIFPMLVSLKTEDVESRAPLDLICVLDISGSMDGMKLDLLKNTFNYLLHFLGDNDRLSIVLFNDCAFRLFPFKRTTEENKKIILEKINTIRGRGGTNIHLGMRLAFRVLNERKYKNSVSSIFLLSDGLDNKAGERVKETLSSMNISNDLTIHTFGFGIEHDPQLMSDVASLRDGNFYFIKELDTVDEAFVDGLGGLLSALGQNVIVKIKPEQSEQLSGVEIVKTYGDEAMWKKEGDTYITKLANIISGTQKNFVLELSIPKNLKELQDHQKDIKVASAETSLTLLNGKEINIKANLNILLLNEGEEVKEDEEDNREVMKNFYRVKGGLIMDESRKLADQTKYEEAKKVLIHFKEELENSFLKSEQFIQNLMKDIEQTIKNVEPNVYKDYGRHGIIENARVQMYEKSNIASANPYQNKMQKSMISTVQKMKMM